MQTFGLPGSEPLSPCNDAAAAARAAGLEAAAASARGVEAESRAALEQTRVEIVGMRRGLEQTRRDLESAREAAREASERLDRQGRELAARPSAPPAAGRALLQLPSVRMAGMTTAAAAPSSSGPTWSHRAQRALTTSLTEASEWRTGLKDAIRILGAEAGWDIVVAWCADERTKAMRCVAMWMAAPGEHSLFATSTWQRRLSPTASEVGRLSVARTRTGSVTSARRTTPS